MVVWSELKDAYGPADEIPQLLEELTPDPHADVWTELWGRLCRHGTVYSSSFAALPVIAEAALRWAPRERLMALSLCGHIMSARKGAEYGAVTRDEWSPAVSQLKSLAEESLRAGGWSRLNYSYLLGAWLAFHDEDFWSWCFEGVADREIYLACRSCRRDLAATLGDEAHVAIAGDDGRNPESARNAIIPARADKLQGIESRILEWARFGDQAEIENALLHLCGTTTCPACDAKFAIVPALQARRDAS